MYDYLNLSRIIKKASERAMAHADEYTRAGYSISPEHVVLLTTSHANGMQHLAAMTGELMKDIPPRSLAGLIGTVLGDDKLKSIADIPEARVGDVVYIPDTTLDKTVGYIAASNKPTGTFNILTRKGTLVSHVRKASVVPVTSKSEIEEFFKSVGAEVSKDPTSGIVLGVLSVL